MKQNKCINKWKIATFVLSIITVVSLIATLLLYTQVYSFEFDDKSFNISKQDFDSLKSHIDYNKPARICNIENTCIIVTKID